MDDKQRIIGGAVTGGVAPLATKAADAYLAAKDVAFSEIPWVLIILFGILGAVTVFFTANKARRTILITGVAAPFIILAIIQTHRLTLAKGDTDKAVGAAKALRETITANNPPASELGLEAVQALSESNPAL